MPKVSSFPLRLATQLIDSDTFPMLTNAGEEIRLPVSEARQAVGPGWSATVNAYNEAGVSREIKIQAAIGRAVSIGADRVFVPTSMLPYDASAITFNTAIQMVAEGGPAWTVYDARAYGAHEDGSTNDSPSLQAAGNAAALNNGILWLNPGKSYAVSSRVALTLVNNFTLSGDGARIVSSVADTGSLVGIIELTGGISTSVVLLGFTLAHTYTSGNTLAGVRIGTTVDTLFCREVTVTGTPYYGMDVNVNTASSFINCEWSSNRQGGLGMGGPSSILLLNPVASSNGPGDISSGYGISLSGSNFEILGGRMLNNDRMGIDLRRANNGVVNGAYIFNSGYLGVYSVNEDSEKDSGNIKVVNCTIDMNNRAGSDAPIWLGMFGSSSTSDFGEASVTNNTLKNSLQTGVHITGASSSKYVKKVIVSDNVMEGITAYAVNIDGGSDRIKEAVVENNILNNTGSILVSNVDNQVVRGNLRSQTSGNASNFIATTGDLYTEITDNVSDMTYVDKPFTWQATRYVVKDNLAVWGPIYRELINSKSSIPDNTATGFIQVSVPNIEIGGMMLVDYVVNDVDKGDIYYAGQLIVQIVRYPGVTAKFSIANSVAQQSLSTASGWGRTITLSFTGTQAGAAGATNTVTLNVLADTSDNLTSHIRYNARFLHGGKIGGATDMTMVPL